ncbi:MAG TPA: PadR family transcriptional regulator [Vicinamibacteria bacterium]|nr:PadR family transcriptional regulator [Vicinamibacteria bacterium]
MGRLDDRAGKLLPLTPAVFHILLALADGPRHGLGIAEEVEAATSARVRFGPGTLYGTIKRLVDSGLIVETRERPPAEEDDPRRRYYRLTPLGLRAAELESERLAAILAIARRKSVHRA